MHCNAEDSQYNISYIMAYYVVGLTDFQIYFPVLKWF